MLRYCQNCKKEFDFSIKSMSDMEQLICPECGEKVGKNSRKPVDTLGTGITEQKIGYAYARIMHFFYIFYFLCAVLGYCAFFFKLDRFLYIITAIPVSAFLIQTVFRTSTFPMGMVFLPIGAGLGYFFLHSIQGICIGVHSVFLIRHVLRDILFRLIGKLLKLK
ncbi:MAG: zinc ribbon domain-containing protein [Treponema sp.]|nr:zinc ribbon domain-containing protein [Treponema sp.]